MTKKFDPSNPPELCKHCPDLGSNSLFEQFSSQELYHLACADCGLRLLQNKTIYPCQAF